MVSSTLIVSLLASAASARSVKRGTGEIKCPVVLSGFVLADKTPTDFDAYATSPFNPDYIRGSEKFSQILQFPDVGSSRFDNASTKSVEVTINDKSIFQTQNGFRRAGLQIQGDTNEGGPGSKGVRTLHFSVKQDPERTLNLTHEYLNVWHEASDFSANQFNFQTGTLIGKTGGNANTFKVLNRQNTQVWETPTDPTAWQNFAITLDFVKNTLQVYYSKDDEPLEAVTAALSNDNSGEGQYQIGILKKPTGTSDVVNSGFQETGIDEGQIYGGLFIEDSANGCISL
ncbi:uncharacterized protein GGS22DRAFT_194025 [Annulohypoxylon maeteangense]|uniref:uncharacterized protein n=1 Tax=Annulohypoxylon maeteangense TaxID=1927788 RepID=UPI002008C82F|nr:uncharacterized protein GGS22DRAFT_194025 [Annulohypoxylon maeteangense]KAI0889616.1 hypothetical protein GGS22DRAFT_194025 [Annulohypoxylon maeteangense]